MYRNALTKLKEVSNTLKATDFSGEYFVLATEESGIQYFFPDAFVRVWEDPIDGVHYWLIFPEHADPVAIAIEDDTIINGKFSRIRNENTCLFLKRTEIPNI